MSDFTSKRDFQISIFLLGLGLITRLPFISKILFHWDSVNFAFAMHQFDLAHDQPQPPGYIVYVWLCRLVDYIFHDPQSTMVAISVVASISSGIALYFLGKEMFSWRVGFAAALLWMVSPLYWFYSEIALPHTLDGFLVILSALFSYRVFNRKREYIVPLVIVLAIAGGIRQQTLVFLSPMVLFVVIKTGWKRFILPGIVGVVLCLAWFIPLIQLSGGFDRYFYLMNVFSERFQSTTSLLMGAGLWGLIRNASKLAFYTGYAWNVMALPVLIAFVMMLRRRHRLLLSSRDWFLLLWIVPAVLFYLVVHMGQQGLVFVFLPALFLWSAAALEYLLTKKAQFAWVLVLLAGVNILIFVGLPEYPLDHSEIRLYTRNTLVNSDQYYIERFSSVREQYSAKDTLILATNWHHLEYYLPDFTVLPIDIRAKREVDAGTILINSTEIKIPLSLFALESQNSGKIALVIFDEDLQPFIHFQSGEPMDHDSSTAVLPSYLIDENSIIIITKDAILVTP